MTSEQFATVVLSVIGIVGGYFIIKWFINHTPKENKEEVKS